MSSLQWSLLLSIIAAVATVFGGILVVGRKERTGSTLYHLIAFGAGFMLAAAFLKMIPESIGLIKSAPLWILAGYVLAHLFEHTFTTHFHFGEETHSEHMVNPGVSTSALVGLVLHAMFDGISISSGFMISGALGCFIALAVILHKIPEGVTIASVMIASGRESRAALNSTIVLALATVFGTVVMLGLGQFRAIALALSAGIATYVAASDLIPELNKLKEMRFSLSALVGVILFFIIDFVLAQVGIS